ncbi:MAG: hypothetical protein LBT67_01545, partial [Holosporaceae bacterium]|nr:hypothetical protein [Holosporaceae bacterium]
MMGNKILCLLALLLSTITYTGDIFAVKKTSVEIKRMSSVKNLPFLSGESRTLSLRNYSALIKKLNELMRNDQSIKMKVADNLFSRDEVKRDFIKDFTTKCNFLAQATLYECAKFLGVEKHPSSDGVFSIDYSWPNIRRIAHELVNRRAKDILNEIFHRTKYYVKYIGISDIDKEKYLKTVLREIRKNQDALKILLEKIDEVKIKSKKRSRVAFTVDQINEFIDLCAGEDAAFNTTLLSDEDQKHFRDRL